jgi:transcriptional regulator with XRE-family HTH domain
MATLGQYLKNAREAQGIDLRDAAQQTRINSQYLKALESDDFTKLPGEVFVKGFLKSYSKFLRLNEAEVMGKYAELQKKPLVQPATESIQSVKVEEEIPTDSKLSFEPFLWAGGITLVILFFLFSALPHRQSDKPQRAAMPAQTGPVEMVTSPVPTPARDKLYLEVIALENTWLLVRTDASPQKKAVLKKGESLIWSADDRFLLSYGSAGAIKLLLNGQELIVDEPNSAVIRDLVVTQQGIVNKKSSLEREQQAKKQKRQASQQQKPLPQVQSRPSGSAVIKTPAPTLAPITAPTKTLTSLPAPATAPVITASVQSPAVPKKAPADRADNPWQ